MKIKLILVFIRGANHVSNMTSCPVFSTLHYCYDLLIPPPCVKRQREKEVSLHLSAHKRRKHGEEGKLLLFVIPSSRRTQSTIAEKRATFLLPPNQCSCTLNMFQCWPQTCFIKFYKCQSSYICILLCTVQPGAEFMLSISSFLSPSTQHNVHSVNDAPLEVK